MESPDWFDLKNYPASVDPDYWSRQILMRLCLRGMVDTPLPVEYEGKLGVEDFKLMFKTIILKTANRPSAPLLKLPAASLLSLSDVSDIRDWMLEPKIAESMEQLSGYEALKYRDEDGFKKWLNVGRQSVQELVVGTKSVSNPIISINPYADMKTILRSVEMLVIEARESHSVPVPARTVDRRDFADWFTYSILPCWDLVIWAEITSQKITNSELGDLLWPEARFDRAERIRKTTKAKYWQVVSDSTLGRFTV